MEGRRSITLNNISPVSYLLEWERESGLGNSNLASYPFAPSAVFRDWMGSMLLDMAPTHEGSTDVQ